MNKRNLNAAFLRSAAIQKFKDSILGRRSSSQDSKIEFRINLNPNL